MSGNGCLALDFWGQLDRAASVVARMDEVAAEVTQREPIAAASTGAFHSFRAAYAKEDPWTGLKRALAVRARSEEINYQRGIAFSRAYAGMNLWFLGAFAEAERELSSAENAIDNIGTISSSMSLVFVLAERGALEEAARILLAQGRAVEALAVAEDAMARYTSMRACGLFRGASLRLVHAESLWATGDHDGARRAIVAACAAISANAAKIEDPAFRESFLGSVPENARTFMLARRWLGEGGGLETRSTLDDAGAAAVAGIVTEG